MTTAINDTHDPGRRSWIASATVPDTEFPIQNLPLGIFQSGGSDARGGVAIGDSILDLAAAVDAGLFSGGAEQAARAAMGPTLNPLMALGNGAASALRAAVSDILTEGSSNQSKAERCLVAMENATMDLPTKIGSFTDFLCSIDHTRRMSPNGSIPPAYNSQPIAYHSRATSVVVSGTPLIRPYGPHRGKDGAVVFGPEPMQDFELELGIFVGPGNVLGQPMSIAEAMDSVFGYCLLNDWSARAIQFLELPPLGPFLGKSVMTTISPWVVTAEAMAPFAKPARVQEEGPPPPHLTNAADQAEGGIDLAMLAEWSTAAMRKNGVPAQVVTETNYDVSYWTPAQMVAHHASNGCNLEPGDLFGSGTVSGPTDNSRATIAELSEKGSTPLDIGGEQRLWLDDGDEVNFRGRASKEGMISIGFGECRGRLDPAVDWPGGIIAD